jgi:non-canonical (house-cleaning) NTP pyrophosphatase
MTETTPVLSNSHGSAAPVPADVRHPAITASAAAAATATSSPSSSLPWYLSWLPEGTMNENTAHILYGISAGLAGAYLYRSIQQVMSLRQEFRPSRSETPQSTASDNDAVDGGGDDDSAPRYMAASHPARTKTRTNEHINVPIKCIGVATTSAIKLEAVKRATEHVFGRTAVIASSKRMSRIASRAITIYGYKADSGVNEQPVGDDETVRGAWNRISHLMRDWRRVSRDQASILISIENGIVQTPARRVVGDDKSLSPLNEWLDVAWIAVQDGESGETFFTSSASTPCNSDVVAAAAAKGFDTTTVGDIMAERYPSSDTKDPHFVLTGGVTRRSDILEEALIIALGRWAHEREQQ